MIGARQSLCIDFAVTIFSDVTSGPKLCQKHGENKRIFIWSLTSLSIAANIFSFIYHILLLLLPPGYD